MGEQLVRMDGCFTKLVSKLFERLDVFNKRVSKLFQWLDISTERVIKPFKRMQIFFERMTEVVRMNANFFQTASKWNSIRKRKAINARFRAKGHICAVFATPLI